MVTKLSNGTIDMTVRIHKATIEKLSKVHPYNTQIVPSEFLFKSEVYSSFVTEVDSNRKIVHHLTSLTPKVDKSPILVVLT